MQQAIPIALQLYTVREAAAKDFAGALERVAEIGFEGVELAGLHGMDPTALQGKLSRLGLKAAAAHVGIQDLEGARFEETCALYRAAGVQTLVCPWWPPEWRKDADDWRAAREVLGAVAQRVEGEGFTFCYHNHDFEFAQVEGVTGWELLFGGTGLKSEMDVYWVSYAGQDPLTLIGAMKGRLPLLHVKDMAAGPERRFANVGKGILNWPNLLTAARQAGAKWYVVEQDDCYGQDPFEAGRAGLAYLKRLRQEAGGHSGPKGQKAAR